MTAVWVDAQLSPALASWLRSAFGVDAHALRDLDLRDAEDQTIFDQARRESVIVVTKDRDFVDLVMRHGPPPQIVWLDLWEYEQRVPARDPAGGVATCGGALAGWGATRRDRRD